MKKGLKAWGHGGREAGKRGTEKLRRSLM